MAVSTQFADVPLAIPRQESSRETAGFSSTAIATAVSTVSIIIPADISADLLICRKWSDGRISTDSTSVYRGGAVSEVRR